MRRTDGPVAARMRPRRIAHDPPAGFAALVGALRLARGTLRVAVGPWVDLAVRLWLAREFLASQVHGMMLGHGPVPTGMMLSHSLAMTAATPLGGLIQGLCPILLLGGVFARPAAAAMLLQTLLLFLPGIDPALRTAFVLLLLRVCLVGAGGLSLDRLVGPGLAVSALPLAGRLAALYRRLAQIGEPVMLLAIRLALVATLLAGIGLALPRWMQASAVVTAMTNAVPWAAALLAAMLLAGLGTRVAALLLLALVPFGQIAASTDDRLTWALLLAIVAVCGPGLVSLDRLVGAFARRVAARVAPVSADLPHVVIVGGGFGGIAAARGLRRAACRVTVIDQRNHHLFQPLLYQVATASLSPADIAPPIRSLFRGQANARVLLGRVAGIDTAAREVLLDGGRLAFDLLVLATGAQHSYFGRDAWAEYAPGLKSIEDATAIRGRLLRAFEEAENTADPAARAAWMTFVIVGGGPTGVELAGAIAELARHGMDEEFRSIEPARARVVLVQSAPRLLPAFDARLSDAAARALAALGVEVRLGGRVEQLDAEGVAVGKERIAARTVIWAAGVMASPAAQWLAAPADTAGRLRVGPDLAVPGFDGIYAIGDTAACDAWAGKPVPGLAPAAKQGGHHVARVIAARLHGRPPPAAFRYRHFGSLATIGRQSAVVEIGRLRVHGALAWWLWGAAHIAFLVGGRNRVRVMLDWLWAYLTLRRGTRLITGTR